MEKYDHYITSIKDLMLRKLGQNSADIKKYFSKKTRFDVSHKLTPKAISFDFNLYHFLANSAEDKSVILFFFFSEHRI